jgi:hypothetical protein
VIKNITIVNNTAAVDEKACDEEASAAAGSDCEVRDAFDSGEDVSHKDASRAQRTSFPHWIPMAAAATLTKDNGLKCAN